MITYNYNIYCNFCGEKAHVTEGFEGVYVCKQCNNEVAMFSSDVPKRIIMNPAMRCSGILTVDLVIDEDNNMSRTYHVGVNVKLGHDIAGEAMRKCLPVQITWDSYIK